ncbi:MAG TPA: 2-oxoacid:acceptor oxidoreductase family protein [Selenomonadales bacterium]|nr:2-oxoacid:acceptor oxidoreductase family protein [Selenomonadales bacterium]
MRMKDKMDIYVIGVGGQGIGLLSEALMRAADYAGLPVRGVDTHGLAQRGGTVTSHIRIGAQAHSALIREGSADMVVALERYEALRALNSHLADGGTLVYYDTVWQPLDVRLGKNPPLAWQVISEECKRGGIREVRVESAKLADTRMQNVVVLAEIAKHALLPGVEHQDYERALQDLLDGRVLEKNLDLFNSIA